MPTIKCILITDYYNPKLICRSGEVRTHAAGRPALLAFQASPFTTWVHFYFFLPFNQFSERYLSNSSNLIFLMEVGKLFISKLKYSSNSNSATEFGKELIMCKLLESNFKYSIFDKL